MGSRGLWKVIQFNLIHAECASHMDVFHTFLHHRTNTWSIGGALWEVGIAMNKLYRFSLMTVSSSLWFAGNLFHPLGTLSQ